MRTFTSTVLILMLIAPLTLAATTPDASVAAVQGEDAGALDAVSYAHNDCAGPGLPGTAPIHATHTTRVTGFAIAPFRPVSFGVTPFAIFGAGPCPVMIDAGVLPQDFTGTWHFTAICRGTQNDGALFADWTAAFVVGRPNGNVFLPGTCIGTLNQAFSLDITIALSETTFQTLTLPPAGGILHTVTQS